MMNFDMCDMGGGGGDPPPPPPIYGPPDPPAPYSSFDAARERQRRSKMGGRKSLVIPKGGLPPRPTDTTPTTP